MILDNVLCVCVIEDMILPLVRLAVPTSDSLVNLNEVCHDDETDQMLLRAALVTFRPLCLSRPHITRAAFAFHSMSEDAPAQQTRMQKTNAKEFYCLTEKDVSIGALCELDWPVTLYPFICACACSWNL